mmetsp:Transcript_10170/g.22913  ORF Transcript_10170/g.22913 Transcript_10170/m.22913 type:complete len:352 (+) Transcript_10170:65-1120(+)
MRSLALSVAAASWIGSALAFEASVQETVHTLLRRAGVAQVLEFPELDVEPLDEGDESGTPIAMMHGMGDFGNNPMGMIPLSRLIAKNAQAYVSRIELCSSPTKLANCNEDDQKNGFLMTMDDQVDQFARVVQADPKFANGFNAVGFSQGNTVIRGYIHKYNRPPVKRHVSMHGVLMGVNGLPQCPMNATVLGPVCRAVDWTIAHVGVYNSFVQEHLAQANYYRDATNLDTYRKDGHFLPYINNEVPGKVNSTFKENFASLEKLVLVMAEDDTMVHPKESEHFGYFKDGSDKELVAMKDAPWYTEDWFGLKTLDQAGKIDFYSTPGNHLRFKEDFLVQMVQKYLAPAQSFTV